MGQSYNWEEYGAMYAKLKCDGINELEAEDKDGVNCPKCKNKGYIAEIDAEDPIYCYTRECECLSRRKALRELKRSGLINMIEQYTFESFKPLASHQKAMLDIAKRFLSSPTGKWLYLGGQVGSGKTHICTAVVGELLNSGKAVRYIRWREEIQEAKRIITDSEKYGKMLNEWKTVEVLYVDDFLKGNSKSGTVNDADTNIAMEILDYRYQHKELITVLSGEKNLDEIMAIDEAVGSRIYERCKDMSIYIERKDGRNYRTAEKKEEICRN